MLPQSLWWMDYFLKAFFVCFLARSSSFPWTVEPWVERHLPSVSRLPSCSTEPRQNVEVGRGLHWCKHSSPFWFGGLTKNKMQIFLLSSSRWRDGSAAALVWWSDSLAGDWRLQVLRMAVGLGWSGRKMHKNTRQLAKDWTQYSS